MKTALRNLGLFFGLTLMAWGMFHIVDALAQRSAMVPNAQPSPIAVQYVKGASGHVRAYWLDYSRPLHVGRENSICDLGVWPKHKPLPFCAMPCGVCTVRLTDG